MLLSEQKPCQTENSIDVSELAQRYGVMLGIPTDPMS
jgi:hypothetical protein